MAKRQSAHERRSDAARRASDRELDAILETAHEAFISIDGDGFVRAWNPEAERTFGWARELAIGRRLSELIVPERYRERHERGLRRARETGEGPLLNKRIEITALHRNGQEFPVEMTISALRQDGDVSFNAFVHDISDRYKAHELQSRLATLVEHSADAIITRDRDAVVTSWNPGAERLYGYTAEEMVGATVDRLVPPEREGEAASLVEQVVASGAIVGFETQRQTKDGRLIDVSITISPIHDDAGRVSEISMIARDVTARREAERALARANEELRRASEVKSQFVAVASHELRTPMTSIGGFATTLRARWDALAEEDKLRFLEVIEQQADRLNRLVDDVLVISRMESGRLAVRRLPVDVAEVARTVARELGLDDELAVRSDGEPTAYGDPDHVHQVLVNYLANAKAHGRPPISVRVSTDERSVTVRVCDSGEGVPAEFVPRLFERFARADESASGGTGLGLAIVRGLAEAGGGEAWYEPGEPTGACFCLRLPRPPNEAG